MSRRINGKTTQPCPATGSEQMVGKQRVKIFAFTQISISKAILKYLTGCLEIPSTCTPRAASNQRGTEKFYVGSVSLVVVLEGQQELVAGEQDDLVLLAVGGPIARNELRFFPVQRQRPRKWRKRVCVYVCVCVCVCAGFLMCRRFFVCIPVSAVSYFCCYPSSTHLTCCASSRRRSAQWRAS